MITKMLQRSVASICLSLILSGCAGLDPQQHNTLLAAPVALAAPVVAPLPVSSNAQSNPGTGSGGQSAVAVNLTPFSGYRDNWNTLKGQGVDFSGAYTRLSISNQLAKDEVGVAADAKRYSPRNAAKRAIVGLDFSMNLTAKVTVGAFESTVPLATVSHQSDAKGEHWSRVIHHSLNNFPLFLVRSDGSSSTPVIKISVKGANSYSSRAAAAGVQAALGVARASGQAASVITRLSEQSTKDKARSIDEAISRLFASGIEEEHWTDRDLRLWGTDKGIAKGVVVDFNIPTADDDWNSAPMAVGSWTLTFDYPRPSIFSDWRVCGADTLPRCAKNRGDAEKNVRAELDASEVLNYALVSSSGGLGTIRAFLAQQDWYLALASQAPGKPTASAFCSRIRNEIVSLGLNAFDAHVVVWAVSKGMPMPVGTPDLSTVDVCKDSIKQFQPTAT